MLAFAAQPLSNASLQSSTGGSTGERRWLALLLMAACGYQLLLCFISTHLHPASRALIGASEALLMVACLPWLLRQLRPGIMVLLALMVAYLCLTSLVADQLKLKALRDLAIPLFFFWLGCNLGKPEQTEWALRRVMALVLAVGLFELLFLDAFTRLFDIFGYYVSSGSLQPITDYVRESRLQLNGIRPEGIGRTFLPGLLGSHRVSSVFLEPVSLGNFACLICAWCLARDANQWRQALPLLCGALVLVVLADSRFALLLIPLLLLLRLVLHGGALGLAALAPLGGLALVLGAGLWVQEDHGDSFIGRVAWCGWALLDFPVQRLLGMELSPNYGDMGYAYLLSRFGLPLCLLLWFSLWLLPLPSARACRMRALISVYIALILAVSGTSLFAFKTSALLWFLLGSLAANQTKSELDQEQARVQEVVL